MRLIDAGPAGCTGTLAPGHTPDPLPAGVACDKTKLSPSACAAACLEAFKGKPGGEV
jgi:hypothetical protein